MKILKMTTICLATATSIKYQYRWAKCVIIVLSLTQNGSRFCTAFKQDNNDDYSNDDDDMPLILHATWKD